MEYKFATIEPAAEEGVITGYGAVFGNVDSHGDVIVPGAFAQSLAYARQTGEWPDMLYHHGQKGDPLAGLPVGVWTDIREDERGLRVEGKMALETPGGRTLYQLMKMQPRPAVNGLSIGYVALRSEKGKARGEKRRLLAVHVREISVLRQPSNPLARIDGVKAMLGEASNLEWRAIEAAIREAGVGRADSVKAIAGLKAYLRRDAGEPGRSHRDDGDAATVDHLRRLAEAFRA